jgi:hypothetical protein
MQFTPTHYLLLDFKNNPILTGIGDITTDHIKEFLWIISVEYKQGDKEARDVFYQALDTLIEAGEDFLSAINVYLWKSFLDLTGGASERPIEKKEPDTRWVTDLIDLIAVNYHWKDDYILGLPLERLLQYRKAISARNMIMAGKEPIVENRLSDPIISRIVWLQKEAAKQSKES